MSEKPKQQAIKGPVPEVFALVGLCGLGVGVWLNWGVPAMLIVVCSIILILGIAGAMR